MKSMRKFAEVLQTTRKARELLKSTFSKTLQPEWAEHKATEKALRINHIKLH